MSTAPTATAVGTAGQTGGDAPLAEQPGKMPADLAERGWAMKEHVGENRDKFQCVNQSLGLTTNPSRLPQDAVGAARKAQAKYDAKHKTAQTAGEAGAGKPYAIARSFTQPLKVKLSPDGLQEKCAEYDAKCAEKEEMEANFKRVHDQYKEDLKKADAEVTALELILRKQYVEVEGEVEERLYFTEKRAVVVRLDTGEELHEREMTPAELQQKLPTL